MDVSRKQRRLEMHDREHETFERHRKQGEGTLEEMATQARKWAAQIGTSGGLHSINHTLTLLDRAFTQEMLHNRNEKFESQVNSCSPH
jgi:hypothetical protein